MKPNNQRKKILLPLVILTLTVSCLFVFTAFTGKQKAASLPVKQTNPDYAGYIPQFKMDPATVNEIISGWALDKKLIFQFSVSGGAGSEVKVMWYEASGMENHGEGREPHWLASIPGTSAISLNDPGNYVLGNNYLQVKTLKTFIRGLPAADLEYLLFTPTYNPVNNHVYFKIKAVFKAGVLKKANVQEAAAFRDTDEVIFEEGLETQPSPPANTNG